MSGGVIVVFNPGGVFSVELSEGEWRVLWRDVLSGEEVEEKKVVKQGGSWEVCAPFEGACAVRLEKVE
jgi:hypothetical protein